MEALLAEEVKKRLHWSFYWEDGVSQKPHCQWKVKVMKAKEMN
jgi:hypothetical protein